MSSNEIEKPLFIPLNREHYCAFVDGSKGDEQRLYGSRWNEKTCRIGRAVLLSLGYGKQHRTTGVITSFERVPFDKGSGAAQEIYADRPDDIAVIGIEVEYEA